VPKTERAHISARNVRRRDTASTLTRRVCCAATGQGRSDALRDVRWP